MPSGGLKIRMQPRRVARLGARSRLGRPFVRISLNYCAIYPCRAIASCWQRNLRCWSGKRLLEKRSPLLLLLPHLRHVTHTQRGLHRKFAVSHPLSFRLFRRCHQRLPHQRYHLHHRRRIIAVHCSLNFLRSHFSFPFPCLPQKLLMAVRFVRLSWRQCPSSTPYTPSVCPFICRLIWLLVHTATLISMVAVLMLTWEHFVAQYFVINLKDPLYPVQNVPFPAVSICSNNRISLQAATAYALEL